MPVTTETTLKPEHVARALGRADKLLEDIHRLKQYVAPSDPLAAFVISAEASAKASRTILLPLHRAAREAQEADETAPRQLRLVGGKP